MQTYAEMQDEIAKLNASQRKAMRSIVCSRLDAITVQQIGWTTRINCEANGFRYFAKLGPRGRKLNPVQIWDK